MISGEYALNYLPNYTKKYSLNYLDKNYINENSKIIVIIILIIIFIFLINYILF